MKSYQNSPIKLSRQHLENSADEDLQMMKVLDWRQHSRNSQIDD